jgi:ubiquinone/menaquinone biosynthesis C-methylase UbiE
MNNFLKEYLKIYYDIPPHALWRAIEARLFAKIEFVPPILDLGCGDGIFSYILFKDKSVKIDAGCDISEEAISRARNLGIYKELKIADATNLPYDNNYFSTVFSNCVLEHIKNETMVLKEVSRVLKPNGKFIFTVPSDMFNKYLYKINIKKGNVKKAIYYIDKLNRRLEHFHYHSIKEWKQLLSENGLFIVQYHYYLPEPVVEIWSILMKIFTKNLLGRESFTWIKNSRYTRIIGIDKIFSLINPFIFEKLLVKYYMMDCDENTKGGGLFIVAQKIV